MGTTISEDKYRYTVFFDIDKTLISKISGRELVYSAIRNGYINPLQLFRNAITYFLYKIRIIDPHTMSDKLIRWTRGIPQDNIDELCYETTERILIPSIYNGALDEIALHRRNNARLVLLSATVTQVCSLIAKEVGADDFICTELESRDGTMTGTTSGVLCFGEGKKERLRDYCYKNNTGPSESFYYGDSISDLPVFLSVGHPVCINPSRMLRKTATERGWQILSWTT
jgi:HAD superfamily hydrolase (TIGR01490 family)